jgi:hypothetical protein
MIMLRAKRNLNNDRVAGRSAEWTEMVDERKTGAARQD